MKQIIYILLSLSINLVYSQEAYRLSDIKSSKSESLTFDRVRALDEINVNGQANSYPWISSDGLRLYYSQSGTNYRIYSASRSSIFSKFGDIKELNINRQGWDVYSICLTENELEAYYVMYNPSSRDLYPKLYYSSRKDISSDFTTPVPVNLKDNIYKRVQGIQYPSITPDKSQMCIYNSHSHGMIESIFILNRIDSVNYQLIDSLPKPSYSSLDFSLKPGQLSKDIHKYILGLADILYGGQQIYYYSRTNAGNKFPNLIYKVNILDPITYYDCYQPSLSAGDKVLVFVSNSNGSTQSNRLYTAINQETGIQEEADKQIFLTTPYPNPSSEGFTVRYRLPADVRSGTLEFYNYSGIKVNEATIDKQEGSLQFTHNEFSSGFYLYSIKTSTGSSLSRKLIVL
jgi:hypothetical protein